MTRRDVLKSTLLLPAISRSVTRKFWVPFAPTAIESLQSHGLPKLGEPYDKSLPQVLACRLNTHRSKLGGWDVTVTYQFMQTS